MKRHLDVLPDMVNRLIVSTNYCLVLMHSLQSIIQY